MATEKIELIKLNIDQEELVTNMTLLSNKIKEQKQELKDLENANKALAEQGKDNTQQYKDNSTQMELVKANTKGLSAEYRTNQKVLVDIVSTEKAQLGTLQQLKIQNAELRKEQQGLNLTTAEGVKRNKEINIQIDKNTEFTKEHSDALVQDKMNVGNYGSALDGLPGPMGGVVGGIKKMIIAAKAFIATPLGMILAALALVIGIMGKAFRNSQKLMDIFNQSAAALSATISVLRDRISNFVEWELSLFNKDLRESRKASKELSDELLGLDDTMSKGEKRRARRQAKKGLFEEMKEEAAAAKALEKEMQDLEDAEIAFTVAKAELIKKIEQNKLAVKDANLTDEERLNLLDEALAFQDELVSKEVGFAKERARISQAQVKLGNSTREEMKANAELQAAAIEIEAAGFRQQKTVATERLGYVKKLRTAEAKALEQKEKDYQAELQLWIDFDNDLKSAKEKSAEEWLKSEMSALDKEIADKLTIEKRDDEYEKARSLFNLVSKRALDEQEETNEFERLKTNLKYRKEAEIEAAKEVGGDVALINTRYALLEIALGRETKNQKLLIISDFIGQLGGLFGEQTKIAKAAAVVQTTIDTYVGAQSVFAMTPGGIVVKTIAAGIAVGMGIANVKKILSVKAGGGVSASPSISAPQASVSSVISSTGGIITRDINENVDSYIGRTSRIDQTVLVIDEATAKQRGIKEVDQAAVI